MWSMWTHRFGKSRLRSVDWGRVVIVVLCLVACSARGAVGEVRTRVVGVGGNEHAWLIVERTSPAPAPDRPEPVSSTLYHLPADVDGEGVTVHRAPNDLGTLPARIAAWDDRLAFAPPRHENTPDGLIPLRVIEVEAVAGGRFVYSSASPVEPIESGGTLESLSWSGGRLTAVVRERGVGPRLVRRIGGAWHEVGLPQGIDRGARIEVVASESQFLLGEIGSRGGRLWNAPIPDEAGGALAWRVTGFASTRVPGLDVVACGGQVVTVDRDGSRIALGLIRGSSHTALGVLEAGANGALVALGDRLAFVEAAGKPGDLWTAKVLGIDGAVLYDGPVELAGPIAPGEVQALAVLMASVFVSILVFVLRPASTWGGVVALPPGTALADPMRRLAAFSVDLIPGVLVGWLVFGREATLGDTGVWPLLVIGAVTIVHSTIGEALSGRTLGKLVTACRTISVDGGRPTFVQAFLHSSVKVLCPPLAMFVLVAPFAMGPASFGTVVVVDVPDEGGASGGDDGSDGA